eukprot:gene25111-biopygen2972
MTPTMTVTAKPALRPATAAAAPVQTHAMRSGRNSPRCAAQARASPSAPSGTTNAATAHTLPASSNGWSFIATACTQACSPQRPLRCARTCAGAWSKPSRASARRLGRHAAPRAQQQQPHTAPRKAGAAARSAQPACVHAAPGRPPAHKRARNSHANSRPPHCVAVPARPHALRGAAAAAAAAIPAQHAEARGWCGGCDPRRWCPLYSRQGSLRKHTTRGASALMTATLHATMAATVPAGWTRSFKMRHPLSHRLLQPNGRNHTTLLGTCRGETHSLWCWRIR